ncbi:hypothetical protein BC938DRAFT_477738 [Jimgerdemannia flammicorona]|uniref:Protein YOP1 n=1 Tax=Jimgerdemannia flammicorona TaxID=994334 RepID=A0A433QNX4_9FUNG|nr:hypothetical protein BC938DRAFT_477738 [Jimgerdemannia flammicorona]
MTRFSRGKKETVFSSSRGSVTKRAWAGLNFVLSVTSGNDLSDHAISDFFFLLHTQPTKLVAFSRHFLYTQPTLHSRLSNLPDMMTTGNVQLFMEPESLSNSTTVGPLSPSTRRLTYWTVFGFIQIIEFFSDVVLYWFPFYYLFKTLLVLWLALPQFRGAEVVYTRFLRPQLLRAAPSVDKAVTQAKQQAAQLAADVNEHQE